MQAVCVNGRQKKQNFLNPLESTDKSTDKERGLQKIKDRGLESNKPVICSSGLILSNLYSFPQV